MGRQVWVCNECGAESLGYFGQCQSCGAWGTLAVGFFDLNKGVFYGDDGTQ